MARSVPKTRSNTPSGISSSMAYGIAGALSVVVVLLGIVSAGSLSNKVVVFAPAFLAIILIAFYGLMLEPKAFVPTRVQRYARRPQPVDELALILRTQGTALAGQRLYKVMRTALCTRLGLKGDCSDDKLIQTAEARFPQYVGGIRRMLSDCKGIESGEVKVASEKEFIRHYNRLSKLLSAVASKQ